MGVPNKVTGKAKQVVGDRTGDEETRREGQQAKRIRARSGWSGQHL